MARSCFVIGEIGETGSEARQRADKLLKHLIRKALEPEPLSLDVERADDIDEPGLITQQIIQRLDDADLVVADLANRNANVYYELAIRHFLNKPVVHLIPELERLPFDNFDSRAIRYDLDDFDAVDRAQDELRAQAEFALTHPGEPLNPILTARIVRDLKISGVPTEQALSKILEGMTDIAQSVEALHSVALDSADTIYATAARLFGDRPGLNERGHYRGQLQARGTWGTAGLLEHLKASLQRQTKQPRHGEGDSDSGDPKDTQPPSR